VTRCGPPFGSATGPRPSRPAPCWTTFENDLALLLADDLEQALELPPIPNETAGSRGVQSIGPATFVDCVVGLWAFSVELVRAVELLAAPSLEPPGAVARSGTPPDEGEGPLLR
jgi:hypothetical protein